MLIVVRSVLLIRWICETHWSHSLTILTEVSRQHLLFQHLILFRLQHFRGFQLQFLGKIWVIFLLAKYREYHFLLNMNGWVNGRHWLELFHQWSLTCSFPLFAKNTGDSGKKNSNTAAADGTIRYIFACSKISKYVPSKNETINAKFIDVSSIPLRAPRILNTKLLDLVISF